MTKSVKTFLQAALAYITVNGIYITSTDDKDYLKMTIAGVLVAACASGLSAVMNLEEDKNDL